MADQRGGRGHPNRARGSGSVGWDDDKVGGYEDGLLARGKVPRGKDDGLCVCLGGG